MQIREEEPDLWAEIYTPTHHAEHVLATNPEPHFSQPDLYKHHFVCMSAQVKKLSKLSVTARFETVRTAIKTAMDLNSKIADMPLDLDPNGGGDHLQPWLDALNRFYRRFLKE